MTIKLKLKPWQLYLLIFFVGVLFGKDWSRQFISNDFFTPSITLSPSPSVKDVLSKTNEFIKVTRVIDGDTIELEGGDKVRYIGIDAPEIVDPNQPSGCFGYEASEKNKELVEGKAVRLEKDVSEADKYGRLLRYVYVVAEGTEIMVNEELVKQGFALSSTYPPNVKYQNLFITAQTQARENRRGLWGSCPNSSANTLKAPIQSYFSDSPTSSNPSEKNCLIKGNISTTGEKVYHLPGCGSYEKTVINETTGEKYFCTESEAVGAGFRKAKNCP